MEPRHGQVASFDNQAGYGELIDNLGNSWFFHCTAILDGSRTISVDKSVTFRLVAGRVGRWEAAEVQPLG
ncbi:MAG: cold shock domain-containing protein [Acidimicrobiia bacterium]